MLSNLSDVFSNKDLGRKEKILIALAVEGFSPKQVKEIKVVCLTHGLPEAAKWNVSQLLKDLGNLVVKLPQGWSITSSGKAQLSELGVIDDPGPAAKSHVVLRKYVSQIRSDRSKEFLAEAVKALEYGLLRSAVVLSWVGAVSILYEEVLANHLTAFNSECSKRNPKWKAAKSIDGLSSMKEYDFLQVVQAISMIGKNTKHELELCLKLRNSCGHPNSFRLGENRVASHIEVLVLNVYQQFNPI